VFTGMMNLDANVEVTGKNVAWEARFENTPGKMFSQHLNIGAINVLANLGSGSAVKILGQQNFYYRKFAGIVSYRDGFLTIEGAAKKTKDASYILTAESFSRGIINIRVDQKNNTIRLSDLQRRLSNSLGTA
jgi:hypothetical protein